MTGGSDGWVTDKPKITDPDILSRIQQALVRGPIYLRHALYRGGGCANWDVVTNYEQFIGQMSHSKAGDWFRAWSILDLTEHNLHFLYSKHATFSLVSEEAAIDFAEIRRFLKTGREVLLIFITSSSSKCSEALFADEEGYDALVDMASTFTGQALELYAFDMEIFWNASYMLMDAKVPNANGEVPIGGTY